MAQKFKITYQTFASPNPEVDRLYDEAVVKAKSGFGKTFPFYINGETDTSDTTFDKISPTDLDLNMGTFYEATDEQVAAAVAAAKAAFPAWRATPWQERVALMRKAADLISDRVFEIGAVLSIEVGKNRLEALGDVEESADLVRYCCDALEANNGFMHKMNSPADNVHNRSILKPFGVWGVISPFNFPAALSAGPCGAALVAGNTVVHKPAEDAPYTSWLIDMCFVDAGLPKGVFNFVTGAEKPGKAIVAHPDVAGITFTGSYDVGMSIVRQFGLTGAYARPVVLEMGGKNPAIVTENADLDKAAIGVMRSSFGLSGQKCSACSRVFVHASVRDAFVEKLVALTEKINVGDPTDKDNYIGPVINADAYANYQKWVAQLADAGTILTGGTTLDMNGYYVTPTIVTDLPADNPLWKTEMFLPIVKIASYHDRDAAMNRANDVLFGLTAGLFSEDDSEIEWFLDNIQSGVCYINRPAGATTGAWPGYQAFGGWKGSTGTNKAAGSHYYLQQYMREQSHTIVT
jgi:1-pyrroline-5-carboxylate dehydrogenase